MGRKVGSAPVVTVFAERPEGEDSHGRAEERGQNCMRPGRVAARTGRGAEAKGWPGVRQFPPGTGAKDVGS